MEHRPGLKTLSFNRLRGKGTKTAAREEAAGKTAKDRAARRLQDREGFFGGGAVGGADDEGDGEFVGALGGGDDADAVGAEGRVDAAGGAGDVFHAVAADGEEADVLDDVGRIVQGDLAVAVQRGEGRAGGGEILRGDREGDAELGGRLGDEADVDAGARQGAENGRGDAHAAYQPGAADIDEGEPFLHDKARNCMIRSRFGLGNHRPAVRIGHIDHVNGKAGLHHGQERSRSKDAVGHGAEHRRFLIGQCRDVQDRIPEDVELRGRAVAGGDGQGHHVLPTPAEPDAVPLGRMSIPAGKHVEARRGGPLPDALHRGVPVRAEGAMVLLADHHFGPVDKGAAHDRMDRLGAQARAFGEHIVPDGLESGPIDHALVDIMAERLEFRVNLRREGRIRHHLLEIVADGREGRLRVDPFVHRLLQRVDEHLPDLVLGFHHQDGILLRKVAQILRRRLRQLENTGYHSSQVLSKR